MKFLPERGKLGIFDLPMKDTPPFGGFVVSQWVPREGMKNKPREAVQGILHMGLSQLVRNIADTRKQRYEISRVRHKTTHFPPPEPRSRRWWSPAWPRRSGARSPWPSCPSWPRGRSRGSRWCPGPASLRGETKGSKIKGKMGVRWDSRDGLDGHQPTASRCDFYL